MSHRPECRRLCRLISESLHSYSDLASDCLTDEIEKDLLIALSQVFRDVKQWTYQLESDDELLADHVDERQCLVTTTSHSDNRHCLANIIGELMFLLAANSQYVQHLAGNILVAISDFLLISDSGWDDFMHLLCVCLEIAIRNSLRSSSQTCALETGYVDYDPSTAESLLKPKLKSANWCMVAAIFRVLRNIQKSLNQECDDKIMIPCLDTVTTLLLNLPWDNLREIYAAHNTEALKIFAKDDLQQAEIVQQREIAMFFGNLIQFISSLVSHSTVIEDGVGFSPVVSRIIDLVAKFTAWCHTDLQSHDHIRISHYIRHKVLMVMLKLSSNIHIDQTMPVKWMHLIRKYFEDLLSQPIVSGVNVDQDGFMEGSPFCTSISDPEKQTMLYSHLQRLAIFLFLKCSLSFVTMKESPHEVQFTPDSKSFIELHKWLKARFHADILANHEPYFERCIRFSLSFLQLFMHEDDILFEMLLQLFHVPFYPDRQIIKDEPLADVENNLVFLASDLFNPVHLFHLFLSEIHYDHQVLLDYLISKDTGSSCAEYLLRSLRIICNSWSSFVEFPGSKHDLDQLCPKRLPFVSAKDCLISLSTSINSLNQKNLFPYNPQVLLRRLIRFEELCI